MGNVAPAAASYLPFIPLIVGLGAVVLGTLGNSALEWWKQALGDRRSRRVVRRLLFTELKWAKDQLEGALDLLDLKISAGETYILPVIEAYPLWEASIKDVGLLTANEAGLVARAYLHLGTITDALRHVGVLERLNGRLYCNGGGQHREELTALYTTLLDDVVAALDMLERKGGRGRNSDALSPSYARGHSFAVEQ